MEKHPLSGWTAVLEPRGESRTNDRVDDTPLYTSPATNPFFPPIKAVEKLSRPKAELPKGWPVPLGPPIVHLATVDHGTIPREACERKSSPFSRGEPFCALLPQPALLALLLDY